MGKGGRYSYGKFGHKIKECPYDKKRSKDVCSQIQATNSVAQSGHLGPPQVASSSTSSGYLQNQFYALPSYHEYESSPDVVTTFEWKVSSMSSKARFISYLKSKRLISKWLVVDSVADIVDYWITFNEPHVFCMLTYCAGAWPGGNPDMLEVATSALPTGVFNQTMNWIAIAHSKAYDYIHEKRFPSTPYAFLFSIQGTMRFFISPSCLKNPQCLGEGYAGEYLPIGVFSPSGVWQRRTNHRFDNMNTAQAYCITMAVLIYFDCCGLMLLSKPSSAVVGVAHHVSFMHPYGLFDVAAVSVANSMTLLPFLDSISDKMDYIGINYYGQQEVICGAGLKLVETDEYSESGRGVYPDGLFRVLLQFDERYKHLDLPFVITENGVSDGTDLIRQPYLLEHLLATYAAMIMGVRVLGYLFWTISDNWEWADGYGPKFGLVAVDRANNLARIPRPSYYLFSKVVESGKIMREDREKVWGELQTAAKDGKRRPFYRSVNKYGLMYAGNYVDTKRIDTPNDIVSNMVREHVISLDYHQAWRAKIKEVKMLRGDPTESYQKIPGYLYMLKKHYPGFIVSLEKTDENRFLYAFVALDASIRGWKYCRPIVVVDGAVLKWLYGGTMLTASILDLGGKTYF
ncbi:Beta-glucosidase-like SFR2, chloroplastic [Capsicum annuum]|uniref:Beta-glucosidase-like SFR2, chloroplastic n=1 Tax=Capsicum annuum TaxID=4072 RepID=A0A2G3AIR0_CAPAN|nr:Beta-glucosidase-like SFR2, chloroplastic [Capsicum annuum]